MDYEIVAKIKNARNVQELFEINGFPLTVGKLGNSASSPKFGTRAKGTHVATVNGEGKISWKSLLPAGYKEARDLSLTFEMAAHGGALPEDLTFSLFPVVNGGHNILGKFYVNDTSDPAGRHYFCTGTESMQVVSHADTLAAIRELNMMQPFLDAQFSDRRGQKKISAFFGWIKTPQDNDTIQFLRLRHVLNECAQTLQANTVYMVSNLTLLRRNGGSFASPLDFRANAIG